jgi:hypothetical protein
LPAASVALTSNVCGPVASPAYSFGDPHPVKAPPSSRHSKLEPPSLEPKENDAEVEVTVPDGPAEIVVSGGVVSGSGGGGGGGGLPPVPSVW